MSDHDTIQASCPMLGDDEREAVSRVLDSGRLGGNGPEVEAFERELASAFGAARAVAVSSGTAALFLALSQYVRPGDHVLTSPITFFATCEAIIACGAVPVFCDVDNAGQMDVDAAEAAICSNGKITAVCPVHMYGSMVDVRDLVAICAQHGLSVIEDACQAHGAHYVSTWQYAGTIGNYGAMSFYATKHITTLGEGGAIFCREDSPVDPLLSMRTHGMSGYDSHICHGWNWRMTEAAAAVGRVQLQRFVKGAQDSRREQCNAIIADIMGLEYLDVLAAPDGVQHGYFWLPVYIDDMAHAKGFKAHMREAGVEVRQRYTTPVYRQPIMRKAFGSEYVKAQVAECPNAERLMPRVFGLPTKASMTDEEVARIIHAVRSYRP